MALKPDQRRPYHTAEYKGKQYRLLFLGPTKFGRRAQLQFLDGTNTFWVDADQCWVYPPNETCGSTGKSGEVKASGSTQTTTKTKAKTTTKTRRSGGLKRGRCYECDAWGDLGERCLECNEGSHVDTRR